MAYKKSQDNLKYLESTFKMTTKVFSEADRKFV